MPELAPGESCRQRPAAPGWRDCSCCWERTRKYVHTGDEDDALRHGAVGRAARFCRRHGTRRDAKCPRRGRRLSWRETGIDVHPERYTPPAASQDIWTLADGGVDPNAGLIWRTRCVWWERLANAMAASAGLVVDRSHLRVIRV